jgi:hypothetical protein
LLSPIALERVVCAPRRRSICEETSEVVQRIFEGFSGFAQADDGSHC